MHARRVGIRLRIGVGFLLGLAGSGLQADTLELTPIADTSLFSPNPDNNLGASDTLVVGTTAHGQPSRAVLRFNLSQVPAEAVILSASLEFTANKAPAGAVASNFEAHRMLKAWVEGTGSDGLGNPAPPGVSTWNERIRPGVRWGTPGGAPGVDFVAAASGSVRVANPDRYRLTGSGLVDDLKQWLAGTALNEGWLLLSNAENLPATARRIASREDENNAPTLTVEFTVPSPVPELLRWGVNGDQFEIEFRVVAGHGYSVQYQDALSATAGWQSLRILDPSPSNTTAIVSDPIGLHTARFYRVTDLSATLSTTIAR